MAFAFLVSLTPQPPNDLWWHLKVGEIIWAARRVPQAQMFAWTFPADTPFVYAAWLGELWLYHLHQVGGLALVLAVRTALVVGAFWTVATEARRRCGSWRLTALPLALACAMVLNNLIARPQMWSFLPFVLYGVLLQRFVEERLDARWVLGLPLMMAVWVNLHGAFVLGGVLIALYAAGTGLQALQKERRPAALRHLRWLVFIGALTALAMLLNPQGPRIAAYVMDLMTDRPSQKLVVEWQSPTPEGVANTAFFAGVLILLVVLAYSRYRPSATDTLLLAAFLWLAWSGQRYVVWFALITTPILAQALAGLPIRWPILPVQRNTLNAVLMAALALPVILVQPWWVERVPLPETYWVQVLRDTEAGPLVDTATPVGAATYLREHPGGHLFNEMGYGSYLIWALPEQGGFIDPRVELYSYEMWQDYIRIGQGVRYNELLGRYGVDRILLDRASQAELSRQLAADWRWNLEYEDTYAQIWQRSH